MIFSLYLLYIYHDVVQVFGFPSIDSFLNAVPTAELEPISEAYTQTDEEDIGLSYNELNDIGKLRKIDRCGPYFMYKRWDAVLCCFLDNLL